MSADIKVDWGGDHIILDISEGAVDINLAILPETAEQTIKHLEWAIQEVARFQFHLAEGKSAGRYVGKAKPGRVGGESGAQ